jgi:ketosteroid isomerase-like protein
VSQREVEIVRRIYDATARRDAAAVAAHYDPDVEWDDSGSPPAEIMRRGANRGYEALQAWFREWHEAWEHITYECEELIDAGDRVVSVVTMRGRGRASGLKVEWPQYATWTIRDGKVVQALWFRTREEALEAVGLRE